MPCTLCKSIHINERTNKRHERLQQVGMTERIARPGKAKAIWITHYVCEVCETEWRHVDDPANPKVGWEIRRVPQPCE